MRRTGLCLVFVLLAAGVWAQERVDLTTPIVQPSIVSYTVASLFLDWDGAAIRIIVKGNDGSRVAIEYSGTEATTLMVALNKANLSTRSLHRRILDRLVADGKVAGTVAGSVP